MLVASLLHEALLTGRSSDVSHYGTAAWGMLGFVFLSGAAVGLRIQKREAALIESRSRGEMLERMNRMNLEFLHRMAHELKTPLTVISGYAQLTGIQLAADQVDQETPENPKTIRQEARRLGDMVTRLMEYSYGRTSELRFERVDTADLLDRVRAIAAPNAPEAEGWTFLGWYREASCENAWNFDTDLVEGSMTLYAGVGAEDRSPPRAHRDPPAHRESSCAPGPRAHRDSCSDPGPRAH